MMQAVRRHSDFPFLGYSCLYALGGGAVAQGGAFPQPQVLTPACRATYRQYFVSMYQCLLPVTIVRDCMLHASALSKLLKRNCAHLSC